MHTILDLFGLVLAMNAAIGSYYILFFAIAGSRMAKRGRTLAISVVIAAALVTYVPALRPAGEWVAWGAHRSLALTLFLIAVVNLFTKLDATVAGLIFSFVLFGVFEVSEHYTRKKHKGEAHVELDQFNVASQKELSPESVDCRPGNVLVPVSNYHAMYHLAGVLDRVKPERRDVLTCRRV